MNDKEKCLFDLRGYIVVEDVLSPAQVALSNEAIDCHAASIQNRPADLSGGGQAGGPERPQRVAPEPAHL